MRRSNLLPHERLLNNDAGRHALSPSASLFASLHDAAAGGSSLEECLLAKAGAALGFHRRALLRYYVIGDRLMFAARFVSSATHPAITPNWICTDASGNATKGPWPTSTDQTAQSVRIEWPNGTTTVGGDYKVDDVTDPTITPVQNGGIGILIPTQSDRKWGSGFKFGSGGWSSITATFQNTSTGAYYNGSGYSSASKVYFTGTSVPAGGGYDISWAVTPPPQSAHNSYDTYKWCVYSNDYFYSCFACIYFYGPR